MSRRNDAEAAEAAEASATTPIQPTVRSRKKPRAPRTRLTHVEVRRGDTLRLRIAVADDALAEIGDELGALIKKIAPSTRADVIHAAPAPIETADFFVSRDHDEHDAVYHAELRGQLAQLFGSLCDAGLADALDIARQETTRRADGTN